MNCPVCKTVELKISDRSGIEIDYCPQCRGVWLDRGELDKIIERSAAYEEHPQQSAPSTTDPRKSREEYDRHYNRDYDDDDYRQDYDSRDPRYRDPKSRKKKSFLGEVFDIFD